MSASPAKMVSIGPVPRPIIPAHHICLPNLSRGARVSSPPWIIAPPRNYQMTNIRLSYLPGGYCIIGTAAR